MRCSIIPTPVKQFFKVPVSFACPFGGSFLSQRKEQDIGSLILQEKQTHQINSPIIKTTIIYSSKCREVVLNSRVNFL
jgi:hypothetical protein